MPATIGLLSLRGATPLLVQLLALAVSVSPAGGQIAKYDTSLYRGLVWREVGPFRGGRVTAVAGSSAQPLVYYMGGTGGGVWKTVDGGGDVATGLGQVSHRRVDRRARRGAL